jgi:hypothetical protein
MTNSWRLYDTPPALIYGFHGCDRAVADRVLEGSERLLPSENEYDWLGHGIYFWENDPQRAFEFADQAARRTSRASRGKITTPAVIGAVIDLGQCLNLLSAKHIEEFKGAYEISRSNPTVAGLANDEKHFGARYLDCAVVQTLHEYRRERGFHPYDSVRSVFWEGKPIYEGAGIHDRNHIQVCVCNVACIKGYFRPIAD